MKLKREKFRQGEEVIITMKKGSRQFFSKDRPVAFGKRKDVEKKLPVPCEQGEWIILIVVVNKLNGTI